MTTPAPSRFHIPRGTTRASAKRKRQRERSNINNVAGDIVASINSIVGSLTLLAGAGITITPSGQDITIASTGGGGSPAAHAVNVTGDGGTLNLGSGQFAMKFTTIDFDTDSWFSLGSPSRITVATKGVYLVRSAVFVDATGDTFQSMAHVVHDVNGAGGVDAGDFYVPPAFTQTLLWTSLVSLNAGDYLQAVVIMTNHAGDPAPVLEPIAFSAHLVGTT